MGVVGILATIYVIYRLIKEACEPTIPAENFGNTELMEQDKRSGISEKQFWKNVRNGKYILHETYSPPPKSEEGWVIVQNSILYNQDVNKYGWYKANLWAKKGKYNLSREELEAEKYREKKKYENIYITR